MGRPIKPNKPSANERVKQSVANLIEAGGARKTWRLKPEVNSALKAIIKLTGAKTETQVIERLILAERNRLDPLPGKGKKAK